MLTTVLPERPWTSTTLRPDLEPTTGRGTAISHHGELLQGSFRDDAGNVLPGLVTLPFASLRSTATFYPSSTGPVLALNAAGSKAVRAASLALQALGHPELGGAVAIDSNIPPGRGLGSSTADVVATIRAVANSLRARCSTDQLAALAVQAEVAADSTMFDRPVLFAQRHGRVLEVFQGQLPRAFLIGFDTADRGTITATLDLRPVEHSLTEVQKFELLRAALRHAYRHGRIDLVGKVATASTRIHLRHRRAPVIEELLPRVQDLGASGLQVSHSGTIGGLLYPAEAGADPDVVERAMRALRSAGATSIWGCHVGG